MNHPISLMFDLLLGKMREHVKLSDEDFARCEPHFHPLEIAKGGYLLQAGEVAVHAAFVQQGLFRTFVLDGDGQEHILQFSLPGWWVGDLGSFSSGKPSKFHVEALEDSEVLQISRKGWDTILAEVPVFMRYQLLIMENNLVSTQNRFIESISTDARAKYENLLASFPDIFQRVPQYMIASYLGMSRETLSRVRRHLGEDR